MLALIACLIGCTTGGTQFDETKVTQITKGQTTEQDLLQLFGKPYHRTTKSNGTTILIWMYYATSLKAQSMVPIAGPFMGGMKKHQKRLSVAIVEGKVTAYSLSDTDS